MNKLEQAAREVIRQHSMECLSDKTVDALREALADHTVRCKGCDELFDKICLDDDGVCASCGWPVWPAKKQAEQEPVVNKSLTTQEQKYACNPHPNAPHGFCRDESITQDRYVCECEFWEQEQSEQEPVAEVVLRKQTVGFGRTEERKDVMFLADVGVGSKLYAKPQQQAEQEPVVKIHKYNEFQTLGSLNLPIGTKLYAAPVRTKDLTDGEVLDVFEKAACHETYRMLEGCRAVIAADREKNR